MTTHIHRFEHTTGCRWDSDHGQWICVAHPDPAHSEQLVDVRDMIVVHTALLREFRLAPAAVVRVEPGAVKRAAAVDRHLGLLCDLLHHHHQGEDDLLWPLLRQRVPTAAMTLIDEVESQHAGIDQALRTVTAARASWLPDPHPDNRNDLAVALQRLYELLKAHLDLEESGVLPLAACLLDDAEWRAIGDSGAAAMSKSVLVLAFGMFAYEGDPVVLRAMLASAPALPRFLVPRIAPLVYARRARQVHGTRHP